MIYGPWAIIIGHCIANFCTFDLTPPMPDNTFSDQYTCELAGRLIDDIGTQETVWPIKVRHGCYNWVDKIVKEQSEKERKRPKAPKPAPPILQKSM